MSVKTKIVEFQARIAVVVSDLQHEKEGLTTVEYAVAGALIAAAVVAAFGALGTQVGSVINNITTAIGG